MKIIIKFFKGEKGLRLSREDSESLREAVEETLEESESFQEFIYDFVSEKEVEEGIDISYEVT